MPCQLSLRISTPYVLSLPTSILHFLFFPIPLSCSLIAIPLPCSPFFHIPLPCSPFLHIPLWTGSKWPPVLKVWEQLCDNHSQVGQNTYRQKAFAILLLKMSQEFCYPTQKLRKTNLKFRFCYPSFFFFLLCSFFFFLLHLSSSSFFFIMRNSKTIGRI